MNDKNAVIAKIISDAEAAAGERERIASEKAEALVSSARKAAAAYMQKMLAGGDERVEQILSRSRSVDALDTRRELSACKSRLTDEAFSAAAQELKRTKRRIRHFSRAAFPQMRRTGTKWSYAQRTKKLLRPHL